MHTAILREDMFEMQMAGQPASASQVLDWGPLDRLGVVVTSPLGGMGASLLIQLALVCFYDMPGHRRRDPVLNPEVYLIHVGGRFGNHGAYDFWPARKEVFVDADPMAVLDGINNYGITHLLVPEGPAQQAAFNWREPETAQDRIKRCFFYASAGTVSDPDLIIRTQSIQLLMNSLRTLWPEDMLRILAARRGDPLMEADMARVVKLYRDRADEVSPEDRVEQETRFNSARQHVELTETYRRVSVSAALGRLCPD